VSLTYTNKTFDIYFFIRNSKSSAVNSIQENIFNYFFKLCISYLIEVIILFLHTNPI
jgi:hypothetical protein